MNINGLINFKPGCPLELVVHHDDQSCDTVVVNHTYNENQIDWFRYGSALNGIAKKHKLLS